MDTVPTGFRDKLAHLVAQMEQDVPRPIIDWKLAREPWVRQPNTPYTQHQTGFIVRRISLLRKRPHVRGRRFLLGMYTVRLFTSC